MALIVSQNGKDAKRVPRTSFGDEAELQQYLYENPDVIPLNEIQEDIRLLILAREFQTESGPIDAVGVDAEGHLYLIETKLYKNQDKRHVVAQVLDYGASLWRHYGDFDSFRAVLERKVQEKWNMSLEDKLASFFSLSPEDVPNMLASMRQGLDDGEFKFVVLMDQLHERLKDLIRFINRYSTFGLYAVEIEYYKHDSYEIMIPRLFGAEVKKDSSTTRKSRQLRTYSIDEHFEGSCAAMRPTFEKLEASLLQAVSSIELDPKQQYISFKVDGEWAFSMITRASRLMFWLRHKDNSYNDPQKLLKHDPDNYPSFTVTKDTNLVDAVELLRQASTF